MTFPGCGSVPTQVAIPVDWYRALDGRLEPYDDTRWIEVFLHPDGSVTWGEPVVIPGGTISGASK